MPGGIASIPLVEIHQMVVIIYEVERAHARKVALDGTGQIREPGAVVGRGQKQHSTALIHHLQSFRGTHGISGPAQDAFHQKAPKAVGDETHWPLPDACTRQSVEGIFCSAREAHRCTRIRIFAPKEGNPHTLPFGGSGRIPQRPNPDL